MKTLTKQDLDQYAALASLSKQATIPGEQFSELVRLAKIGLAAGKELELWWTDWHENRCSPRCESLEKHLKDCWEELLK